MATHGESHVWESSGPPITTSGGGGREVRSVTPAMNNTRGASASSSNNNNRPFSNNNNNNASPMLMRHASPQRYYGSSYNAESTTNNPNTTTSSSSNNQSRVITSSGLIRLTLRKPMGIVFEPMYDVHQPSVQRGVRICDLPRTGAAAMSRLLQVGDELLSINDKTMSRLTFDEIMDFIIEADPEHVHLLFRRPRKQQPQSSPGGANATTTKHSSPFNANSPKESVKWIDEEDDEEEDDEDDDDVVNHNAKSSSKKSKHSNRHYKSKSTKNKKSSRKQQQQSSLSEVEDDVTLETMDDFESTRKSRSKKAKRHVYESESFLDLLIDTICANPDTVCKSERASAKFSDEEEDFDDDDTFGSYDNSTYVTYEDDETAEPPKQSKNNKTALKHKNNSNNNKHHSSSKQQLRDDDSSTFQSQGEEEEFEVTEEEVTETEDDVPPAAAAAASKDHRFGRFRRGNKSAAAAPTATTTTPSFNNSKKKSPQKQRAKEDLKIKATPQEYTNNNKNVPAPIITNDPQTPQTNANNILGLVPTPNVAPVPGQGGIKESNNSSSNQQAPISEVVYDYDQGADVSVMESLGGPSLLIEKQRQLAASQELAAKQQQAVSREIMAEFGTQFPTEGNLTREETILKDPIRFYSFVVKGLLEEHEPEKVRLLDKLLAKYKGREDHLVQKLSVRYHRPEEEETPQQQQEKEEMAQAVVRNKDTEETKRAVSLAEQKAAATFGTWPDKETKEPEPQDAAPFVKESAAAADPRDFHQHEPNNNNTDGRRDKESDEESDFSGESIDGTSPAVIAQVSELLNYVYGKTSVPGQIDRVSTIMRAYEGREAVLLELLETKALIKANSEKENVANLPAFLRNSPALQQQQQEQQEPDNDDDDPERSDVVSPLSSPNTNNNNNNAQQQQQEGGNMINDDISSMSGVSSPVPEATVQHHHKPEDPPVTMSLMKPASKKALVATQAAASKATTTTSAPNHRNEKKKKGLFGGLFKKKQNGGRRIRKGNRADEGEI